MIVVIIIQNKRCDNYTTILYNTSSLQLFICIMVNFFEINFFYIFLDYYSNTGIKYILTDKKIDV